MEILKVSSKSNPNKVAGAIAGVLSKSDQVELQAIGAGAVNQAVKSVAIASRFLGEQGTKISMIPGFVEIQIGEEMRTGITLRVTAEERGEMSEITSKEKEPVEEEPVTED
ncbi:MAG TPA: stage V sporulation protein S [Kosmotogaceae bacterium]|nr:MAG: Stage V sporulation protein S [Thermotogales bacterium 46_20]HAA85231.1 stage V sporulation protein S [Kosmotogaceae bacterium]